MAKIIREKYESGVLVSREIEVRGRDAFKVAKLCVQIIIAICLAVIAVTLVRDSVAYSFPGEPTDVIGPASSPATVYRS